MEWKENVEKFGDSLKPAYENGDECKLDISLIPSTLLLPLIENQIKDEVEEEELSEIQPFEGGLRIDNDNCSIEWTCCENIGDFYNWKSTIDNPSDQWTHLWIGHPWIFFRVRNNKIQFSDYTDDFEAEDAKPSVKMELDYNNFKDALQIKIDEMNEFKQSIIQAIRQSNLADKEIIETQIMDTPEGNTNLKIN